MSIVDLTTLPAPDVIEPLDYDAIFTRRKAAFIALWPDEKKAQWEDALALESEPVTKLLQENAYLELILRARINAAARATMLAYAAGADLDHIGALHNTPRKTLAEAAADSEAVLEPDSEYRPRIQMAFESLTVAGSRDAYIWHALSAHPDVIDATAVSPNPAYVTVTVLSRQGDGTASAEVLNAVNTRLSADTVRPIADRLTVQSAQAVNYEIEAQIYTYPLPEVEPILAAARENIQRYASEKRRLGRDVTLSALYAAMHVSGVQRVVITKPTADIKISPAQAAYCTNISIIHAGTDE